MALSNPDRARDRARRAQKVGGPRCYRPGDLLTALLGVIKASFVLIPVNTLMTADDYRFMLADMFHVAWLMRSLARSRRATRCERSRCPRADPEGLSVRGGVDCSE
jgi:hypothetical protein